MKRERRPIAPQRWFAGNGMIMEGVSPVPPPGMPPTLYRVHHIENEIGNQLCDAYPAQRHHIFPYIMAILSDQKRDYCR